MFTDEEIQYQRLIFQKKNDWKKNWFRPLLYQWAIVLMLKRYCSNCSSWLINWTCVFCAMSMECIIFIHCKSSQNKLLGKQPQTVLSETHHIQKRQRQAVKMQVKRNMANECSSHTLGMPIGRKLHHSSFRRHNLAHLLCGKYLLLITYSLRTNTTTSETQWLSW